MRNFMLFAILLLLTSCFALPVEEPVLLPPLVYDFEPAVHPTITAERGNLQRYHTLSPRIMPAVEVSARFTIPDVYIQAVHVEVGDEVRAGDIVAELDREALTQVLYTAEREINAANIRISHIDERQPLEELETQIRGGGFDENIHQDARRGHQTEIAAHRLATEHFRAEDERRVLRAPMDGTVTQTLAFVPGDVSRIDVDVVTVADESQSFFSVTGRETRYLTPGSVHTITINQEPHDAVVISVENDQALLTLYSGGLYHFPERTFLSLHIVLDEVTDVIFVPARALQRVQDRALVYVMEGDLRVMREVVTGLVGNNGVEIVSGLREGEVVAIG